MNAIIHQQQALATPESAVDNALAQVQREERIFELAQRKAKVYATSSLVPKEYQGNIGNVMVAMNMANRLNADLLQVMQNLYIVHGRPAWSSQFLIATFNTCGRFTAVKYRFTGEVGKPSWGCVAFCMEIGTGEIIEGTEITMKMAESEGWLNKNGSKWKTMPEQMLRYRSAAFLIRTTAPEVSMGLMTVEEAEDVGGLVSRPSSNGRVMIEAMPEELLGEPTPAIEEEPQPDELVNEQFEQSRRVRAQYLEQLNSTFKLGALKSLLKDATEDELLDEVDRQVVTTEIEDRIRVTESTQ